MTRKVYRRGNPFDLRNIGQAVNFCHSIQQFLS